MQQAPPRPGRSACGLLPPRMHLTHAGSCVFCCRRSRLGWADQCRQVLFGLTQASNAMLERIAECTCAALGLRCLSMHSIRKAAHCTTLSWPVGYITVAGVEIRPWGNAFIGCCRCGFTQQCRQWGRAVDEAAAKQGNVLYYSRYCDRPSHQHIYREAVAVAHTTYTHAAPVWADPHRIGM